MIGYPIHYARVAAELLDGWVVNSSSGIHFISPEKLIKFEKVNYIRLYHSYLTVYCVDNNLTVTRHFDESLNLVENPTLKIKYPNKNFSVFGLDNNLSDRILSNFEENCIVILNENTKSYKVLKFDKKLLEHRVSNDGCKILLCFSNKVVIIDNPTL